MKIFFPLIVVSLLSEQWKQLKVLNVYLGRKKSQRQFLPTWILGVCKKKKNQTPKKTPTHQVKLEIDGSTCDHLPFRGRKHLKKKKIIALYQNLKANIIQPPLPCYNKVQPASAEQDWASALCNGIHITVPLKRSSLCPWLAYHEAALWLGATSIAPLCSQSLFGSPENLD